MRYRGALGWLIGLTTMLAAPGAALAATVTTTADSGGGSLRAAIAASASGDTIDFAPALNGQTITLTSGALMITHNLTISGPGAASLTINGGNVDSVFNINIVPIASTSVTISGLKITGGSVTGAGGGGIFANSVSALTLNGDNITGNQATVTTTNGGGGGGVFVNGGQLSVSDSTITANSVSVSGASATAMGGGGLYSNGGTITVANSDVSRNSVSQSTSSGDSGGGGIYSNGGDVEIDNTTVRSNSDAINTSAGDDGGGGVNSDGGAVTLNNAAIDGNSFTLTSSTGGNNGGGGVYSNGGNLSMTFSTIDGNSATVGSDTGGDNGGGGLLSEGGSIGVGFSSISSNAFSVTDNTGGDNGGGAILSEGGSGTFLQSTLAGNSVTVSGTSGDNGGGAIYTFGPFVLSGLTIAGNSSNVPVGAILNRSAVQLHNTIIAGNTATPAGNCGGFGGTFTSDGFNLESANTCGLDATKHDLINTAQPLGPLQNNGGPTPTRALPVGSPAVDAGTCTDVVGAMVPVDQRGVARPQPAGGKCDIGAFELVPSAPPPPRAKPAAVPSSPGTPSSTRATFSGSVNPEGQATTVFFQYGLDASDRPPGGPSGIVYDQSTPPQSLPADSTTHTVTASVSGLVPNAHYHVRLVATNATGTTVGQDQTFTTPADKPPPPPVLAKSVNAKPAGGKVFLLIGGKLVPLTEGEQLRSGTVVDTRHGSLQLTTATSKNGKRQTGTFSGAIFKITQVHSGLTTLSLVENAFSGAPSFASCSTKGAHAARVSKKTLQLLHASAKGKFRTKGRYAAATVRGTKWTIADRCDGTLTHDLTDSVVVNDFVRHKTIVLHAGHSYLALAQPPKKKKKK